MYLIYGKSKWGKEELDEAENLETAKYLTREYTIAYGLGWNIWYEVA